MRKIKKALAALAALTVFAVSAVPTNVYAYTDDTDNNLTAEDKAMGETALDLEWYFIENDIDATICIVNITGVGSTSNDGHPRVCNDLIQIRYMHDKDRERIENYIEGMEINSSWIEYRQMDEEDKQIFIRSRIYHFVRDNSLTIEVSYGSDENGMLGVMLKYFLGHEQDKAKAQNYITEKGYDKQTNIYYEFIGDPEADPSSVITDLNEIKTVLDEFISENKLNATTELKDSYVFIDIYDKWYYEESLEPIVKFMTEKHIDQSLIGMSWYKGNDIPGDSNSDGAVDVRDCAYIALMIANGKRADLPYSADYNMDDIVNIRDAAALANDLAGK